MRRREVEADEEHVPTRRTRPWSTTSCGCPKCTSFSTTTCRRTRCRRASQLTPSPLDSSRKTFDLLISSASSDSFNYGTILELDKDYRNLLDSLPDVWLHECAAHEHADPQVRNKRYIAMQGTHVRPPSSPSLLLSRTETDGCALRPQNRLVRLHRPFLVKGWEPNSRYAYSSDACVRSARAVVLSHHNNIDFNRNLRMMYSHTLSAAIVLAADLYHTIDGGAPDAEIESKKCVPSPPLRRSTR